MKETIASNGSVTVNRSPSASSNLTEIRLAAACCRASSIIPGEISTPVTSNPCSARKQDSVPSPQPSSKIRSQIIQISKERTHERDNRIKWLSDSESVAVSEFELDRNSFGCGLLPGFFDHSG